MPPRKTTDFGALFESLIEDLQVQVAASVDRTFSEFSKRLTRIERRLDQLDPDNATPDVPVARRGCSLCERPAVARGMCSAHYQQWRYRERKTRLVQRAKLVSSAETHENPQSVSKDMNPTLILSSASPSSTNN